MLDLAPKLEHGPLADLMAAARDKALAARGARVSYSRKVFIPLTTLCRNTCGYCAFVQAPGSPGAKYLTLDEVVDIARKGQAMGCKEALFSLGERPERRYPEAREALARLGHAKTVDYLEAACAAVLQRTTLIPHINAGALNEAELAQLRPVAGSMGMMLESASSRLMQPGEAHHACPDKSPKVRLRTIDAAGRLGIPFTTGILIGIGESFGERLEALHRINASHARHGHVQEVIVQNFRAKPGTAFADRPEPDSDDMLRTLAAARLLLDPAISLQAPPNLSESFEDYLDAGINDWGGVSPLTLDHINPERAWPAVAELARRSAAKGRALTERLTVYPGFQAASPLAPALAAMAAPDGMAREQCIA